MAYDFGAAATAPSDDLVVTATEEAEAGARAFTASGAPTVTLVVWDRKSDLHDVGEVWGLFVDGRPPRSVGGLEKPIGAVVFAARAHYGRALHLLAGQRGLSAVEGQVLAVAGLLAA